MVSHRRRSTSSVFSNLGAHTASSPLPKQSAELKDGIVNQPLSTIEREMRQEASALTASDLDFVDSRERDELAQILSQDDWGLSEAALFTRLRRRGKEALLPAPWRLDFSTFPEILYSAVGEPSFVSALTPSMEFRGSQALQRLVNVGGQIRDRAEINPKSPIEPLIYQEVRNFITWAERDADISISSVLTVVCNRDRKGSSKTASDRTERKMKTMAHALREKLVPPNTSQIEEAKDRLHSPAHPKVVYGITIYNCVAALSTLNCEQGIGDVKTLLVLDWTDIGLDIWNAIAVALLVVTCRNDILDSDEEARLELSEFPDDDA